MTRKPRPSPAAFAAAAPPTTGAGAGGQSDLTRGQETRTRILRTAFQLFHEQGYHATGVTTILREAGVNAGSLYHFFASKDDLLIGVLEFALVLLRPAVMEPAERRSADPLERVFELLQQYREGMHAWGCRMGCPIGNLALEVADDHAQARELIHRNFENWALAVKKWLDDAGERLPRDVDRAQLARFVLTVMEGGLMQARAAGHLGPYDDSVAQLRAYFAALEKVAVQARAAPSPRGRRRGVGPPRPRSKSRG